MKTAIVHELLTMRGGAERVLKAAAGMFPDAPIYTLLYDEKKLGEWFPKERIRTPFYKFPHSLFAAYHNSHHLFLSAFPKAVESWDFFEYDLVISFSSAFAHGIITNGKPKHLCFVHSPARYLWDRTHDVINRSTKGILGPIKRKYLERMFHNLRIWDCEAAPRPDKLLAASKEVQRRIELYWRRESEIVYPPIDDFWITEGNRESGVGSREYDNIPNPESPIPNPQSRIPYPDYYLIVSTLADYKRIDIAIEACNLTGSCLKIVGEGSAMKRLKNIAGPTVEFYGYREKDELKDLVTAAKAVIFPGLEDFGLVPIEAMSCGTPVIAFRGGGALETIAENETGVFFDEPTFESLAAALKRFKKENFDREACRAQAEKFSRARFEEQIFKAIEEVMM